MTSRFLNRQTQVKSFQRSYGTRTLGTGAAALFLCLFAALPAGAQISVWNGVNMGLTGSVEVGYQNVSGTGPSSHGLALSGNANLTGYYYTPQFIWFEVNPYYNRSEANFSGKSIANRTGVNIFTKFFTASRIPGQINYRNSSSDAETFGIPGVTGLSSDHKGHSWDINWGVKMPSLPSLEVHYRRSASNSSIYGSNLRTEFGNRTFDIRSRYNYGQYKLYGFFRHTSTDGFVPQLDSLGMLSNSRLSGGGNAVGVNVSHPFVLSGQWTLNYVHTTGHSEYRNSIDTNSMGSGNHSGDGIGTSVSMRLTRKLSVGSSLSFNTNSQAAVQSELLDSGVFVPLQTSESGGKTLVTTVSGYYNPKSYLNFYATWTRSEIFPLKRESRALSLFSAGFYSYYTNYLFGTLRYSVGVTDRATKEGNAGSSLRGNVAITKKLGLWKATADANYSQSLHTLGDVFVTSRYGFGGTAQRKFFRYLYWTNSARFNHSALERVEGTNFRNNTFATNISYRRYGASFTYASSSGASVLGINGLVPIPVGVPPSALTNQIYYDADSFAFGASMAGKRYTFSASYSEATSHTSALALQENRSRNLIAEMRIKMRKLYVRAIYRQTRQVVGPPGSPETVVHAMGFSISRWFRVF